MTEELDSWELGVEDEKMRVEGKRTERRSGESGGTGTRSWLAVDWAETKCQTVKWYQGPMKNAKTITGTHKAHRSRGSFILARQPARVKAEKNTAPSRKHSGDIGRSISFKKKLDPPSAFTPRQQTLWVTSSCEQLCQLGSVASQQEERTTHDKN